MRPTITVPPDATWRELFAELPLLEPRAGFVRRVLVALPPRSWFDSPWHRAGLAAALAVVALATALLVPAAVSLARLAGPATLLSLWIGAVADLMSGLGESLGAWGRLAELGRAAGRALAEPRAFALLAANIALAVASVRGLVALTPRRSLSHASLPY